LLNPEDRIAAIKVLGDHQYNRAVSIADGGKTVRKMFTYGFRGFASFSDKELVDALIKIRDSNFQASSILAGIVEAELLK